MAQLTLAIQKGDYDEAIGLLHALRGSSSNLSANRVFAAATALEEMLEQTLSLKKQIQHDPEPTSIGCHCSRGSFSIHPKIAVRLKKTLIYVTICVCSSLFEHVILYV